ncbi:putative secreted protein [Propionispora sp. 2/2-37]|nr:putative secreted protein [Propionispora sp. 2/2-37]
MLRRILLQTLVILLLIGGSCFAEETTLYKEAIELSNTYNDCVNLYTLTDVPYKQFEDKLTEATLKKNNILYGHKNIPTCHKATSIYTKLRCIR